MVRKTERREGRWLPAVLCALALVVALASGAGADGPGAVVVLTFDGAVTPILHGYVERGIQKAEEEGAELLILELDTPGGSSDITKEISQLMIQSSVPIVVYVAPEGAHAGSAGTFITLAAHAAAMAPGSSIGAASPVSGEGQDLPETMLKKATNILVADIKNLAARRGERAAEWAARAVEEAAAATSEEALELGVIDFVAGDLDALLQRLDGFTVQVGGQSRTLHTAGRPVERLALNRFERFMNVVLNPNIAFILLTLGLNAILFELSSPGGYAAGIIGVICLALALYALGVLPVNYSGLFFIALAFILFVLDIKAPTHGALTLGGIASFIFGAMMLFNSPYLRVSRPLVVGVALGTGGFFFFAVTKAVAALRTRSVTGGEGLLGSVASARTALDPDGIVFLEGERWDATVEDGPVAAGESVVVVGREGFHLRVRKQ